MKKFTSVIVSEMGEPKLRLRNYVIGYVGSLVFTIGAYLVVTHRVGATPVIIGIVIALAFSQFLTQLFLFLHLGEEAKPRLKLTVFFGMIIVVAILVGGSIWIMTSLNNRMSIPQEIKYMNSQDGL